MVETLDQAHADNTQGGINNGTEVKIGQPRSLQTRLVSLDCVRNGLKNALVVESPKSCSF
jgi:hypothetical protein